MTRGGTRKATAEILFLAVFAPSPYFHNTTNQGKDEVKANQGSEGLYGALKRIVRGPVHAVMTEIFGAAPGKPLEVEVLEYVNILEYAAEQKASHGQIVATLLKRDPLPQGWSVTQVFMDKDDALIRKDGGLIGRRLQIKTLDSELVDFFGDGESVVFELP